MLRIRTLGLALVAVFALSAIAASAASAALPEFKAPFPKKFTGGNEGPMFMKGPESTDTLLCTKGAAYGGEITGIKKGSMTMRFKACEGPGGRECQTAGANPGEVVTSALGMELGYINKKAKEVGVRFWGTGGTEGVFFAEVECGSGEISLRIKGSIIAPITPVDTATNNFKLPFYEGGGGQGVEKFEGGGRGFLEVSINHGKFGKTVMVAEANILTEGLTEIIA